MEKEHFSAVLKTYINCTEQEAFEVISLKKNFPYSQLLHALAARVSKDHTLPDHQTELQMAAVYATDRTVLKEVMTSKSLSVSWTSVYQAEKAASKVAREPDAIFVGSVADQVMDDLDKLQHLKHNFELLFMEEGGHKVVDQPIQQAESADTTEHAGHFARHRQSSKAKKERIVAMAKALEASREPVAPVEEPAVKPIRKKRNPGETIIEEIVSSKQPIEPESEKQKEQLEIIEQFIKTQPSISNAKDKPVSEAVDLATIQTGEFNDHIVSETLVEILIKQGKKDKAIEVLKKLIWKFPQKKAYFAAQIEELKK